MLKLRSFFCLLAFLISSQVFGQSTFEYPNEDQFYNYLNKRYEEIQSKMYKLTLEGKLTPYKTDSLISVYHAGGEEWPRISFDNELMGLWFMSANESPFNASTQTSYLKSVCLLFQPRYGIALGCIQPLCHLKPEELKKVLDENDYNFLMMLYGFGKDNIKTCACNDYEAYKQRLIDQTTIVSFDTLFFKSISKTLADEHCFIESMQFYSGIENQDQYWVLDVKNKRRIPMNAIGHTFYQKIPYFINTDQEDPTVGFDTIVHQPIVIEKFNSLLFDAKSGQIVHFTVKFDYGDLQQAELEIPRHNFLLYEPAKIMLWLTEDYFRWQLRDKK